MMGGPGQTQRMAAPSRQNFNAAAYLNANPDVNADAGFAADPYSHFEQFGRGEGRSLGRPGQFPGAMPGRAPGGMPFQPQAPQGPGPQMPQRMALSMARGNPYLPQGGGLGISNQLHAGMLPTVMQQYIQQPQYSQFGGLISQLFQNSQAGAGGGLPTTSVNPAPGTDTAFNAANPAPTAPVEEPAYTGPTLRDMFQAQYGGWAGDPTNMSGQQQAQALAYQRLTNPRQNMPREGAGQYIEDVQNGRADGGRFWQQSNRNMDGRQGAEIDLGQAFDADQWQRIQAAMRAQLISSGGGGGGSHSNNSSAGNGGAGMGFG
jgi:hypothetical protein